MEVTNVMMKELDVLQESYMQQVYHCMSVGLIASVFFYTALFVAMTAILHRLIKGETIIAWQDVLLLRIIGINPGVILLGVGGLVRPTTSALVHNASTLAISLSSMKNLLE